MTNSTESAAAQPPVSRPPSREIVHHDLEFVGTGREYFSVWLVNVVLTVLTLGLFTPFARRRTANYFYNHTVVAGSPLEFTGSIKRMMVGFLVVTTLYAFYQLAGWLEYEWAVNFMLVLFALAAPFMWGSAMRFRTRSTRWRGVRPLFVASWGEIYRQSWPVFAIALVWIAVVVAFNHTEFNKALEIAQAMEKLEEQRNDLAVQLFGDDDDIDAAADRDADAAADEDGAVNDAEKDPEKIAEALVSPEEAKLTADYEAVIEKLKQAPYDAFKHSSQAYAKAFQNHWPWPLGLLAFGLLASLPFVVLLEFNYRRLFVTRTQIGSIAGHWKPMYGDFLRVWLATIGVSLLGIVAALFAVGVIAISLRAASGVGSMIWLTLILGMLAFFILFAALSPILAYKEARMFQLLWDNIGIGPVARFKCGLRTWAFVRLRIWNLFLTTVTLGFYRPFARVAEYRMKLESVILYVKGDLDALEGRISQEQGALGDAFADMMGMDLIT